MSRARVTAALLAALVGAVAPRSAAACGAFYGDRVEVDPDQKIVVVHHGGIETYVFRPRFCGAATDFGVILPMPSTLTASPTLASVALFDELDTYTTPTTVVHCVSSSPISCGGAAAGSRDGGEPPPFGTGVDVIDGGKVGIFDWTLVQATSLGAFTDWLGVNGFPYDPTDTDAYQHYVNEGWYFVAFKVSAGTAAPPEGMRLCGDLGPIRLSFASASPVVPARIAGVNAVSTTMPTWRVFVIAPVQHRVVGGTGAFFVTPHFSGALSGLATYGEIAALAEVGDRLTALDVRFAYGSASADIALDPDPSPSDFRAIVTEFRDCGGCQVGGASAGFAAAAVVLVLLRGRRRARGTRSRGPQERPER